MNTGNPPWDLVIFDWDGTLADSIGSIVQAMLEAAQTLQIPAPSEPAVREIIGLGLLEAIQRLFPDLPPDRYGELRDAYSAAYVGNNEQVPLFAGVTECLHALRVADVRLAVATGKSRAGLDRALRSTGLAAHFHATRCADEGPGKPDPGMTHYLLEHLSVVPERAVLVGDTSHDLEMARRAGVAAIGVGWGAHDADSLHAYNPLRVVQTMGDLHALLTGAMEST